MGAAWWRVVAPPLAQLLLCAAQMVHEAPNWLAFGVLAAPVRELSRAD
jgi:hypothetical protein